MEVLLWQLGIFIGIQIATLLFGIWGQRISTGIAVLWTIAMIFTKWLFFLQFVTIFVAFAFSLGMLGSPNIGKWRSNSWSGIVLIAMGLYFISQELAKKNSEANKTQLSPPTYSTSAESSAIRNPSYQEQHSPLPPKAEPEPQPQGPPPEYMAAVARVKQRYPQLNPGSNLYEERLVDMVLNLRTYYMQVGIAADVAVERAADEIMVTSIKKTEPPTQKPSLQQTSRNPPSSIWYECIKEDGSRSFSVDGCQRGEKALIRN